jgi:dipeptidyl aminopeptidase/acylaminoacyl peptidase
MNPDGTQQRQVTSDIPVNGFNMNQLDFSWADDGATLLYPNFDKLYRVNASGGGTAMVYQTQNAKFITEVDVSEDNEIIALITNNSSGYNADIFTINFDGNILTQVMNNVTGAVGGLDLSIRGNMLLYTHDVSGYESNSYRRLDSRLFLYNLATGETTDLSLRKPDGTNDLDPRFSPNEAEVVFVNTSNDEISPRNIYTIRLENYNTDTESRSLLIENGFMPDWE